MNLRIYLFVITIAIFSVSSYSYSGRLFPGFADYFALQINTTVIGNRIAASGSKIMTDQDALVILPPSGMHLVSIELFFSDVQTNVSDSSRLFVKSQRSTSCAPLGNAHPNIPDQYTIAVTRNLLVQTGWNKYIFDSPIPINVDTLYIWPDLLQEVKPRIDYADNTVSHPSIWNLNSTSCANPSQDLSVLDYRCELVFVDYPPCIPFLEITQIDSSCYFADTIVLSTSLASSQTLSLFSSQEVSLSDSIQINFASQMTITMEGCN